MSSLLLCSTPVHGHVTPLLAVARHLVAGGHRVRFLTGARYRDAVEADIERARAYGAGGVPFFVFEEAYAVSGAQPTETFELVLQQVWQATQPALVTLGGTDADVCGPEGCD